jgi:NAD+ diphosphatase
LNRLSFLRTEHTFLSSALKHPSTRFVLLKDLSPLVQNANELYLAQYKDVEKLVSPTIYDKTEEEMIQAYDSRVTKPDMIFLGVDESAASKSSGAALMEWKIYKGQPYFALDVSEKGSDEQRAHAKQLVEAWKEKGITPWVSRTHMSLSPDQGMLVVTKMSDDTRR